MNIRLQKIVKNLSGSGLTIYDPIAIGDTNKWFTTNDLEELLKTALFSTSLKGMPLRTRSKFVKSIICKALGYPIPKIFKKTQPRFTGQLFDIYIQKSNNLQVWNEELDPKRRYVLIQVSGDDVVTNVKVVDGASLALLDTTGSLTQKYQASIRIGDKSAELISNTDTKLLQKLTQSDKVKELAVEPTDEPATANLLPIKLVYEKLVKLIGHAFSDSGHDQERNRGAIIHKLVCTALGYKNYSDDGKFPDIRNQLLEIKLQTSPTIDLGLVTPNSKEPLGITNIENITVRHCDVRYAIFCAKKEGSLIEITNFYLSTGEDFFSRFPQFQGKVLNKKLQIPLPRNFFSS